MKSFNNEICEETSEPINKKNDIVLQLKQTDNVITRHGEYGGGKADMGVAVPADAHIWLKSALSNRSSRGLRAPVCSTDGHHARATWQLRRHSKLNAAENTHRTPADIIT